MTSDELRALLAQLEARYEERSVQYGTEFRCSGGEVLTVFNTGRVNVQGAESRITEAVRAATARSGGRAAQPIVAEPGRGAAIVDAAHRIFIVYGHDVPARDSLELILRRMGFEPIILQNLPAAGDRILEKLERYLGEHGNVGFACVLLTPDDEGDTAGRAEQHRYRARQNVILELGMVLARLGRRRVANSSQGQYRITE